MVAIASPTRFNIPTFITRVRVRARSFRVIFQEFTSRFSLRRRDDHLIQLGFVVCQAIVAPRRIASSQSDATLVSVAS